MKTVLIWLALAVLVIGGLAYWYYSSAPVALAPEATSTPPAIAPPEPEGSFGQETPAPVTPAPAPAPVDDSIFKG